MYLLHFHHQKSYNFCLIIVVENGIRNTNEETQIINEKEILSVYGEEQSKKLSENTELKNIDVIWSSSYTRAKATAKYIANTNNLPINLDSNLNERKLGNLKELGKFMKDKSTRNPSSITPFLILKVNMFN